jgi:hypothetical protein
MLKTAKFISLSLLSACLFLGSAPHAVANSTTRHIMVLPGACTTPSAYGPASATFLPGPGGGSLKLTCANKSPLSGVAAAIITSSQPNIGLTNIPLPMGTITFTATNDSPNVVNAYGVVGYYQNGAFDLGHGKLHGTQTIVVDTVRPNQGQLMAVSFLWLAFGTTPGSATLSKFIVNGTPANGFDLTNEQGCETPYIQPIVTVI